MELPTGLLRETRLVMQLELLTVLQ
jgi:hypothetical protein